VAGGLDVTHSHKKYKSYRISECETDSEDCGASGGGRYQTDGVWCGCGSREVGRVSAHLLLLGGARSTRNPRSSSATNPAGGKNGSQKVTECTVAKR